MLACGSSLVPWCNCTLHSRPHITTCTPYQPSTTHQVFPVHGALLRLKLGVMMTSAWGFTATRAWILLAVLVVLGNEDANNCHLLLSCVCVLFLGIPVSNRQQSRPKQRASNMDRALRQMLQSFPIEDISPFSSDDESYVQADVQGCSSRVYSSSVNNASDADAFAQINGASYQSSGPAPKQLQKQSLYSAAPVTAAVPVSPPVTCLPATPLKWNTRLADRATAEG